MREPRGHQQTTTMTEQTSERGSPPVRIHEIYDVYRKKETTSHRSDRYVMMTTEASVTCKKEREE
jgi:hypothetical protein